MSQQKKLNDLIKALNTMYDDIDGQGMMVAILGNIAESLAIIADALTCQVSQVSEANFDKEMEIMNKFFENFKEKEE